MVTAVVTITIGNSDSFIENADIDRIFDSFFTKKKSGGTGLGLAIAKKIVESHGGQIWCRSDINLGTEFVFPLPCSPILSAFHRGLPRSSGELGGRIYRDRVDSSKYRV